MKIFKVYSEYLKCERHRSKKSKSYKTGFQRKKQDFNTRPKIDRIGELL